METKGSNFHEALPHFSDFIVGDEASAHFRPTIRHRKWGEEAWCAYGLKTAKNISPAFNGKKLEWVDAQADIKSVFFPLDADETKEFGGSEFEVHIGSKTALANTLSSKGTLDLHFETNGLTFTKQLALTPEQLAHPGNYRPDHVVNSWAAYHSSRSQGDKYRTGKAFHLFRLKAIDANGKWTWLDADIDEASRLLKIQIDSWFSTAAYPVVIDPTLGYTTIGGSDVSNSGSIIHAFGETGTAGYTMSENGTLTAINLYCSDNGSSGMHVTLGVYNQGTNYPGTKFAVASEISIVTTIAWFTASASGSLVSGSKYWLAMNHDLGGAQMGMKYDSVSQAMKFIASTYTAGAIDDPYPGSASTFDGKISSYLDYTAAASGNLFRPHENDGLGVGGPFFRNPLN